MKQKICLNMIVKNEAHIIHELIDSVEKHIGYWVIVDTGSTDGTQDLVRKLMAERNIQGKLFERPWRNFGENRTEALQLAQGHGDYILVMDADDTLQGTPELNGLTADAYLMRVQENVTYWRPQLFRNGTPWEYKGALHEFAVCHKPTRELKLEGNYHIHSRRLGARSQDPDKYSRDAQILQEEVNKNPGDSRSVFYLAQSYRDAGNNALAKYWYEKRAEMEGWDEEVFMAMLRSAEEREKLGEPWPDILNAYLRAWNYRPQRAEPLYAIARHYRTNQQYALGHLFAQKASQIPAPEDKLFVDESVYQWKSLEENAVCISWLGRWDETLALYNEVLKRDIPEQERPRIEANINLAISQIKK